MSLKSLVLALVFIAASFFSVRGQSPCRYWQSRVDTRVDLESLTFPDEKDPEVATQGIECLLKFEGNKHLAPLGIQVMTRLNTENLSGPTSILSTPTAAEVAALYMISYLYYQKWDHADWVVLVNRKDSQGLSSSEENVRKAYRYYREWFKRVKAMGLVKARGLKIEPLKAKDVWWRTGR